jgi:hypothetical protein
MAVNVPLHRKARVGQAQDQPGTVALTVMRGGDTLTIHLSADEAYKLSNQLGSEGERAEKRAEAD